MRKTNYSVQKCTAEITVKKNSIKKYQDNVYLKNKQEFEILLRNNTSDVVMATIKINGKEVSNTGLVLKPGQKVYLERFLDLNKKFLYEIYTVDNTSMAKEAIKQNGNIEISFFKERIIKPIVTYRHPQFNNYNSQTATGYNAFVFGTNAPINNSYTYNTSGKSLDTGRVEMGSTSNQSFTDYVGEFESYPSQVISLKILPHSLKPLEVKDLAEYCTECGTKNRKGNYKFCPKCGTKY